MDDITDQHKMPFGKHRGVPLGQVPALTGFAGRTGLRLETSYPEIAAHLEKRKSAIDWELDHEEKD